MRVTINWHPNPQLHQPLYQQLVNYCLQEIETGNWALGDQLPPQRELAAQLQVNRSTIGQAMTQLVDCGVISGKRGGGTTIISNTWSLMMKKAPVNWQEYIQSGHFKANLHTIQTINTHETRMPIRLSTGELAPAFLPHQLFADALTRVGHRLQQLNYLEPQGLLALREQLAQRLQRWGIQASADTILITSGSLQALQLISLSLLDEHATVYTETPTYLNSLQIFQSAGVHLRGLPLTRDGVAYWQLPQTEQQKLLYVIPSFQNPTGQVMTLKHRRELLTFANRRQLPIIEDSAYQDLWFDTRPPQPLKALDDHGAVIYLGSSSKILAPGLRLGWVVAPRPIISRLADVKMQTDYGASSLSQLALAEILANSDFDRYLVQTRTRLQQRAQAALQSLQTYLAPYAKWQEPTGGFYIWLKLDPRIKIDALFDAARAQGVLINPGDLYAFHHVQAIRLSYAYAEPAAFAAGCRILKQLIEIQLTH